MISIRLKVKVTDCQILDEKTHAQFTETLCLSFNFLKFWHIIFDKDKHLFQIFREAYTFFSLNGFHNMKTFLPKS